MDLNDFRATLLGAVRDRADAVGASTQAAFVEHACEVLGEAGEISDAQFASYRGTGSHNRSLGIDAYAFDDADFSLRLVFAAPTFIEPAQSLTVTEVKSSISRVAVLVEDSLSGRTLASIAPSQPAWSLANEINRRASEISRLRVYVLSDGTLSTRATDWPEGAIAGIPLEAHIWDISRFHRLAESTAGRDELVIDFGAHAPGGLPVLLATPGNPEYVAYLLAVPGDLLADIYDEHGSRLLEGNVRAFLSMSRAVNKGIRNTALNLAHMFFAYNNGIAATASEVEVVATPTGPRLMVAKDLQIVNGGQTTATLATARRTDKKPLAGVFVPMKLSVVALDRSAEMVPNIARFANSQNKVSDADFFSNHDFHRRIEDFSRRIWAPAVAGSQHETKWYYERARGSFANDQATLTPARKRQFLAENPRNQVITKTDLAKTEVAWGGEPHLVSLGAQKNFIKFAERISAAWDGGDGQFNEAYFRDVVARTIIFRATERLVSLQSWYQGGYRANVVAYTVAKLPHEVGRQAPGMVVDLEAIWKRQALSPALEAQVIFAAKAMHDVLVAPPSHVQNVTEWAKRATCWDAARDLPVPLLPSFQGTLVSRAKVAEQQAVAKKLQRLDSGIEAQRKVFELGTAYWARLREWAKGRGLFVGDEETLVRMAAGHAPGFPDERQCVRLIALKDRIEGEGFPPA